MLFFAINGNDSSNMGQPENGKDSSKIGQREYKYKLIENDYKIMSSERPHFQGGQHTTCASKTLLDIWRL